MLQAGTAFTTSDRLKDLAGRLEQHAGFAEVLASLQAGHAATLDGVWGSSCALAAAALARHVPETLVALCPHGDDVDDLLDDLPLFADLAAARFPAWESLPNEQTAVDEVFGDRLRVLKSLQSSDRPKLVVASIQSLLQPTPDRQTLARQTRTLGLGTEIRVEELARWLVENGFQNMPAVELPGEFSIRGGIMDIFAPDWFDPVRVEFFGDAI
jgi:transcription-repair coupling factor (superfamily II helicase)